MALDLSNYRHAKYVRFPTGRKPRLSQPLYGFRHGRFLGFLGGDDLRSLRLTSPFSFSAAGHPLIVVHCASLPLS